MATSTSTISTDIGSFFESVYGSKPEVTRGKQNTVYSVPGQGISIITDTYGGCHIDVKEIAPEHIAFAREAIEKLSESFKASGAFDSMWIDVALPSKGNTVFAIAPDSFEIGKPGKCDLIHDYQQNKIKIWKWLNPNKECTIPLGATHNIGATALIIDEAAKKVLLVVNVGRDSSWNLPGGSFEPDKDKAPCDTALREAQEEGGFKIETDSLSKPHLMGQMQFPTNQFAPAINQIWAYFIKGISQKELNPPSDEIKRAEWVDFDKIFKSEGTLDGLNLGERIKRSLIAAINSLGCQEIVDKGWMIVHVPKM